MVKQRREVPRVPETRRSTPSDEPAQSLTTILDWAAAVVPVLTALTALAVWFGFEIVNSRTRYFGIDPSMLGFSTSDFVLRSVSALIRPMVYLLLGCLGAIFLHSAMLRLLRDGHSRPGLLHSVRLVVAILIPVGLVITFVGLKLLTTENLSDYSFGQDCAGMSMGQWWRPSLLSIGVVTVVYAAWLSRQQASGTQVVPVFWRRLVVFVSIVMMFVGIFWSFSLYANAAGALESHSYVCQHFRRFTKVDVYSSEALALTSKSGVSVERIGDADSRYHWHYSGLRLLIRSDEKYFLLPVGWLGQGDFAIVLSESPDLRFEFSPPEEL